MPTQHFPVVNQPITNLQDGLAVIVDGDTCTTAVPAGSYAYIKNNTHGLAEGLYKNKSSSAFPTSGGTANSSVFEADTNGGLNALNTQIENLFTKIDITQSYTCIAADTYEYTGAYVVIPANSIYAIRGATSYAASSQNGAIFSRVNNNITDAWFVAAKSPANCNTCYACGYTASALTLYLFGSWTTANTTNNGMIQGWYCTLS